MGEQELACALPVGYPLRGLYLSHRRWMFADTTCDMLGGAVEKVVQGSDRGPGRTFEPTAAGSEEKALFLP